YLDDVYLFFFFQAEDGIRDYKVTGVQTCALPIYDHGPPLAFFDVFAWGVLLLPKDVKEGERRPVVVCQHGRNGVPRDVIEGDHQIGRASCRERVQSPGAPGALQQKPANTHLSK